MIRHLERIIWPAIETTLTVVIAAAVLDLATVKLAAVAGALAVVKGVREYASVRIAALRTG